MHYVVDALWRVAQEREREERFIRAFCGCGKLEKVQTVHDPYVRIAERIFWPVGRVVRCFDESVECLVNSLYISIS